MDSVKVYYNLDGSVDWLKGIVRTVHVYTEERAVVVTDLPTITEIDHREIIVYVKSTAAPRAQNLYFRKTAWLGGEMAMSALCNGSVENDNDNEC